MRTIAIFVSSLLLSTNLWGQWHDMNWVLGYDFESDESLSETMVVDFSFSPPTVNSFPLELDLTGVSLTLSDAEGDFILYTNGMRVHDVGDNLMPGGDTLNAGEIADGFYGYYYPLSPNSILGLPAPGQDDLYYLVHLREVYDSEFVVAIPDLLFSIVDMKGNDDKGVVTAKNQLIQKSKFFSWDLAAVRHANGRDWWVVAADQLESKYAISRLTMNGFKDTTTQEIGYKPPYDESPDGMGANFFSPDGAKFIDCDANNGIRVFDFDRCTGTLSNIIQFALPEPLPAWHGGIVSPNSRFLYITTGYHVYQYDFEAPDFEASVEVVAEYDGYEDGPFKALLSDGSLGKDGKIYLSSQTKHLHIIHSPNKKGLACDVRQRAIELPEWPTGIPNYPNYRLGPLDGSPCDTLGIDNLPLARFTWEASDQQPLLVQFTDNSFYEPTDWLWDFGGTGTSAEVNPAHIFPTTGTYTVCLTVSNQYDNDTYCQEVTVGVTGTGEAMKGVRVEVFPNPATESVQVNCRLPHGTFATWKLYDPLGREVRRETIFSDNPGISVDLDSLPTGMYYYVLESESGQLARGKLSILE